MSRVSVVGEFGYVVAADRWWSEVMYELFGFAVGEVVPTTALIGSHPGDAQLVAATSRRVLALGGLYSCYCRLIDSGRQVRMWSSLVSGSCRRGCGVATARVSVDMSEPRRRDAAAEAEDAVRGVVEHRAAIEQAEGAPMFMYGADEQAAVALLRRVSQRRNVKVNRLAQQLIATVTANPSFPAASRRLTTLFGPGAGPGRSGLVAHGRR